MIVSAYTASLPQRVGILEKAVSSMLPQVDSMQVVLNNFDYIPAFLNHHKITIVHHDNSLEDGSRFINIEKATPGYTIVFDDDIMYPPNYVSHMISKIESFGGRAIVAPMGKILKRRPVKSYYTDVVTSYRTFLEVKQDSFCDVPGACGIVWDNRIVKITQDIAEVPNGDICIAKFARQNSIPCVVIAHKADWLINLWDMVPKDTPSIFGKYRHNDKLLTDFVNKWI